MSRAMMMETDAQTAAAHVGTVDSISDTELVRRAVRNARSNEYGRRKHPRWVAVSEAFSLGSTYATQLCRRYDLDPDEMVKR